MVYSASSFIALQKFGDSYYFLSKQVTFVLLGCLVRGRDDARRLPRVRAAARWCGRSSGRRGARAAFVLLVGAEAKGARRWFGIAGIGIQPSEFAKFAAVVFTAALLERRMDRIDDSARRAGCRWVVMVAVSPGSS